LLVESIAKLICGGGGHRPRHGLQMGSAAHFLFEALEIKLPISPRSNRFQLYNNFFARALQIRVCEAQHDVYM
jgi:hypothetical protein